MLRNRTVVRATPRGAVPLALILTGGLLCLAPIGLAQNQNSGGGVNQNGPGYVHQQTGINPTPQHGTTEAASQIDQMRQAERRRRVAADTAKLVQLSNDLKAELDKAPSDQLSVDALHKAAEIEKTAHDLKGWINYQ